MYNTKKAVKGNWVKNIIDIIDNRKGSTVPKLSGISSVTTPSTIGVPKGETDADGVDSLRIDGESLSAGFSGDTILKGSSRISLNHSSSIFTTDLKKDTVDLDYLSDVSVSSASGGQGPVYNSGSKKFGNSAIVNSLQGLTGKVSMTSSDKSVTFSVGSSVINLKAAGGGGGLPVTDKDKRVLIGSNLSALIS